MKSYSLMGVVGRDQAQRGQLVAKPVTPPMPELDRERNREKDREMLAQVKEFVGDDDKLLVDYQQDIDIDIGIDSELPNLEFDQEFDQELKDCVDVPRRASRRVLRRESAGESLRAWLRVQVCLRESLRGSFRVWLRVWIGVRLHAERECCVRALGNQLRVDCKRMRVQIAHNSVVLNKSNASAESASSTSPLTRTTQLRCVKPRTVATDAAKVKQVELWRMGKCDLRTKAWEAREKYVLVQNANACRSWELE